MADTRGGDLRVVVHHFALPRYRVPVFRELARTAGVRLTVVFGSAPGLENVEPEGFEARAAAVRRLKVGSGYLIWDLSQWRYATRRRADVLVLTWNVRSILLVPALVRARVSGVRTLLWGHGYSRRDTRLRKALRGFVARLAHGIVYYSHREAALMEHRHRAGTKVFVALNAIDQGPIENARHKWLASADRLHAFRNSERIEGRRVVLFVSRYKPENRVDVLIEAGAILRDSHDLAIVIIGGGTAESSELRELVDRLALGDVVRMLGPQYDEESLAPWFLSADVFCYPANLGLSVFHAFGYGLPVVTGDRGDKSPPEWDAVEPGVNGLHFEHDNPAALAAALDRLIGDHELRRRMADAALEAVRSKYTLGAMVGGLREAIAAVAEGRTRH